MSKKILNFNRKLFPSEHKFEILGGGKIGWSENVNEHGSVQCVVCSVYEVKACIAIMRYENSGRKIHDDIEIIKLN